MCGIVGLFSKTGEAEGDGGRPLGDVLVEMCQDCHSSSADPTLTRSRFDVEKLDQMSRDEKDLAIRRLAMPVETRLRMPPSLFRSLTPIFCDWQCDPIQSLLFLGGAGGDATLTFMLRDLITGAQRN